MTDLFTDVTILLLRIDVFERFAEERVERLCDPPDGRRVVTHGES